MILVMPKPSMTFVSKVWFANANTGEQLHRGAFTCALAINASEMSWRPSTTLADFGD